MGINEFVRGWKEQIKLIKSKMTSIPAEYWMAVIGALCLGILLILYYIAMLLKESVGAMRELTGVLADARNVIKSANAVALKASIIVGNVEALVEKISVSLLDPVNEIAKILNGFARVVRNVGRFLRLTPNSSKAIRREK